MKKLIIGKQLEVSEMALGCLNFGTKTDKKTSFNLLDEYYDKGGNFLDTANNYSFWFNGSRGGESENLLGRWLDEKGNREKIILASKVGARPKESHTGLENAEGLGHKAIMDAVDESLIRMKTDYIDILYAHIDDAATPLNETMETFDTLIKSGKIREIGCSNYTCNRIKEASSISQEHHWQTYCCVQQRHSFLTPLETADFGIQEYATNELLTYLKQHPNLKMLAYSPLLHGFYNKKIALPEKYNTPENYYRLNKLGQIAHELNATPNQVVLSWMTQGSPRVIPIIASSTLDQLHENMNASNLELTVEQLDYLS